MSPPIREIEEKGLQMLKEFREFAMKGNVVDLAVGVIIGAAFGGIVTSLVGDIIMPIVGAVTGGLDFSNYFTGLSKAVTANNLAAAKKQGAVLAWGNFLTLTINFIIIAFVLFLWSIHEQAETQRCTCALKRPGKKNWWPETRDCSGRRAHALRYRGGSAKTPGN